MNPVHNALKFLLAFHAANDEHPEVKAAAEDLALKLLEAENTSHSAPEDNKH
jgi:hypothetical protein